MRGICFAALSPTVIWEPPSGRRGIYKEVHFPAIHYHHRQATLPDVGDRRRLRAAAGRRKPVEVLEGAQHVEVIDPLAELPGRDHRSDEDGGDAVAVEVVVLVEGEDEEAVVGLRPPDI